MPLAIHAALRFLGQPQGLRPRGQALVEFALLLSVLGLLLAGAVDVGLLLRAQLGVVYAARQAARIGAEADQNAGADCAVLGAIYAGTQPLDGAQVTQIIIYQADANGNSTGNQQIYSGNPGCPAPPTPPAGALLSSSWPPATRGTTPPNEDTLGVEIDYTYTWQTGILGSGPLSIRDHSTLRLTPQAAQTGGAR